MINQCLRSEAGPVRRLHVNYTHHDKVVAVEGRRRKRKRRKRKRKRRRRRRKRKKKRRRKRRKRQHVREIIKKPTEHE